MAEVMIAGTTGGREHVIGEVIAAGDHYASFSHGNAGTANLGDNLGLSSIDEIVSFAERNEVNLVIVGPEAPLVAGIGDQLRLLGIPTFGPGADGAQLEASKAWAAEFCREFGIPAPESVVARSTGDALARASERPATSYVIKADGLAGGKGVIAPENHVEAQEGICNMMDNGLFGNAGRVVVFQKRLPQAGDELSAFFVVDGEHFMLLPLSQDHKRLKNNDKGPNTGGMGAYSPLEFVNDRRVDEIMEIGQRTVDGLRLRKIDYRGVIYAGLMEDLDDGGRLKVLEYNVRFGDPEAQVILTGLRRVGIDLYDLLYSAARGGLDQTYAGMNVAKGVGEAALTICLAAKGYPDPSQIKKGDAIHGLDGSYGGVTVYHGSTDIQGDRVVTNGGRALYVTAIGETLNQAATRANCAIGEDGVWFEGMQYRTDIGQRALST